jgi:saccharopine dehydrogenase (NAD+, L-lysine-forming)
MSLNKIIFLRNEIYENEFRTPLIPSDIKILIKNNYIVYVQSSNYRIYPDILYETEGAIITLDNWYNEKYNKCLIIGIKELDNLDKLNNHTHLYFSHSFKKQKNANIILNAFKNSNSIIYDFEFFFSLNQENLKKRIISFGYFAGIVGAILGLKQFYNKKMILNNISNLTPWKSFNEILNYINYEKVYFNNSQNKIQIAIIGAEGKCGTGVQYMLNFLNIKYQKINKNYNNENSDIMVDFKKYDIIFNCILLNELYNKIWFNTNMIYDKDIVIVDISCDYSKINNPIKLYDKATSWNEPVFKYNKFIDIIAIENLPSLLPFESSNDFSKNCVDLLLNYGNEIWKNNLEVFKKKI